MDKKDMLIKNLHKTSNACKIVSNMEQGIRKLLKTRDETDPTIKEYVRTLDKKVIEIIILRAEREAFGL